MSLFLSPSSIDSIIPTDDDIAALPHCRRDQLMLTKFLGSGAFGEVFEGLARNILGDDSGKTKVAVKVRGNERRVERNVWSDDLP